MLVLIEVRTALDTGWGRTEAFLAWSLARGGAPGRTAAALRLEAGRGADRGLRRFFLGFVDTSIVATAEPPGITQLATLDRQHFSASGLTYRRLHDLG